MNEKFKTDESMKSSKTQKKVTTFNNGNRVQNFLMKS